ncbi:MAG: DNA polymerase III subunit alpha [Betaproteobacteria bacterium]|nr:DNA polymerase III subunit alpha [Betaproteobacteria bacterium]
MSTPETPKTDDAGRAPRFVHLRLHSEYSVTDGIVRIDDAVARAAADGMPALALTDVCNLFGLVKFYKAARGKGVKPLIGADCWVTNEAERDKPSRILLLAASRAGYLRLSELLSRAWLGNQHRARAGLRKEWLADGGSEGLIALSGAAYGEVGIALAADNPAAAEALALEWSRMFPGRYYIELQRAGFPNGETLVARSVQLAGRLGLPVVATHPVQFLDTDDFKAHEARVCISQGYVLGDQRRPKLFTPEQYFKSQDEMAALFADIPQALENAVEIARRCSLAVELGKSRLPLFPTPEGVTLDDYLGQQAHEGLTLRLAKLFPDAAARAAAEPGYRERLDFEIKTIVQMGFPGYFLIVADFINWAKNNGVPVGPGRGSGAGSLVAYSLGITDLDPIRYELLFERFLNPERVSMPDFDIDFCQDGRDRVIEYVRNKYGADSVSQIATFGTMAARAVVRDTGRVLDLGYNFCDQIAKLIPFQPGKTITLEDARRMEPLLAEREKKEDEVRELLELGGKLEGLTRNVGMHAGGVLIAPGKLTDFCPLYAAEGTDNVISQLDKDDVEAVGLVKFDFLGLTTLTILDWAVRYVRLLGDRDFDLDKVPLDDRAAYDMLSAGNTTAVFQLESRGMRDMIKRARPDRFEDIIALVALYRPGPMDLIPDFIERKHGRQRVEYVHPLLEGVLKPTYGIMVYQEQVMQAAQLCAGYSLGGADMLRRAMGKKKAEEMAEQRAIFVAGAAEKGIEKAKANEIFDYMEKFAGYGFNKSHAAAYALVAYHTAYMKAHHAAAFMAANLSAVMDDTDKVRALQEDCVANGIRVLPPDVNASDYRFVPIDAKTVRYGLGGIRGTGRSAIENIMAARKERPFADLFDFCRRVDKRTVNRRAMEAMVRAGAFDSLEPNRAALLASVGLAIEAAEQDERQASQVSLFGDPSESRSAALKLVETRAWDLKQKLIEEKVALGFTLSGHLFDVYARDLEGFSRTPLARLAPTQGTVWMAGIVAAARAQMTRRGKMMVVTLDDGSAQVEITVFNELFERHRDKLKEDSLLVVNGKVQEDNFSGGMRVTSEDLLDLATLRARYGQRLRIAMNGQSDANKLKELLAPYRAGGQGGGCRVMVHYHNGTAEVDVVLGAEWRVRPDELLLSQLGEWLSPHNVQLTYAGAAAPSYE